MVAVPDTAVVVVAGPDSNYPQVQPGWLSQAEEVVELREALVVQVEFRLFGMVNPEMEAGAVLGGLQPPEAAEEVGEKQV